MNDDRHSDTYERSAGGLDYDDAIRDRAASFGSRLASGGPEALFEEIENMIPQQVREQVSRFPITAVALGVGIGILLGMKKGAEIIAAGSSLVAAAATANLNQFMAARSGATHSEEET